MKNSVKALAVALCVCSVMGLAAPASHAEITGKSVLAGALSLIIWPGIGQAVNDNAGKKVVTHAVVGLLPPFRFWSGYDALVTRQGGYWEGRI